MRRSNSLIAFGVLLVLMGGLWTAQGLGYVGGSFMSGVALWAIVGPLVAGFGLALLLVQFRAR